MLATASAQVCVPLGHSSLYLYMISGRQYTADNDHRPYNRHTHYITLRAKLSSAVYCNRACLFLCGFVCLFVCLWVGCHDNSKLRASIFTKLGLWVKVVTISSGIRFWSSFAPGKGVCGGAKIFGSAFLQPARSVCVTLSAFFHCMVQ